MRIVVINHINYADSKMIKYLISPLAEKWREDGHDVEFFSGCRKFSSADLALLHVDLSVVPKSYIKFARRYPRILNERVIDIRKSAISPNLIGLKSDYQGQVIAKTDLNAGGNPEHFYERYPFEEKRLLVRLWRTAVRAISGTNVPDPPGKDYKIFDNIKHVPPNILNNQRYIIEKFLPEIENGLYFTRRCHVLGNRSITQRMGNPNPLGGGFAPVFEWIDCDPEVLEIARKFGLDYGAIDYTVVKGRVNMFDLNKTIGLGGLEYAEIRENHAKVVEHLAPGIYSFFR